MAFACTVLVSCTGIVERKQELLELVKVRWAQYGASGHGANSHGAGSTAQVVLCR